MRIIPFHLILQQHHCNCLLFNSKTAVVLKILRVLIHFSLYIFNFHKKREKFRGLSEREWELKWSLVIVICCWGLVETFLWYRYHIFFVWLVGENKYKCAMCTIALWLKIAKSSDFQRIKKWFVQYFMRFCFVCK